MVVLLLSLILTVLEVVVNTTIVAREFELFVRDTEKYVMLISILSHAVGLLLNLALGTPSTHTLEWKFSARVFPVESKTPLTSRFVVRLLQLLQSSLESTLSIRTSPPKSRCRTSTAVPIPEIDRLSRPSPQQIYLTTHPVFTLLESLQS